MNRRSLPNRASHLESRIARLVLILIATVGLGLLLFAPLLLVFSEAFRKGLPVVIETLADEDSMASFWLTLKVAAISVPLNMVIGVSGAWAIGKFEFKGRDLLLTLIDLPFSVSPVVTGLIFVLMFGAQGWLGPWLQAHNIQILFALPAIVLVTIFVTFPFVARELIPLMQAQGNAEEEAALTLGATGWMVFFKVTLPNIRWALFYGVLLCNARAMGEFGAVAVVSGHIRGLTNTMPLHIEVLYNEFNFVGAFAVAALLTGLALLTLMAKTFLEWRHADELASHNRH